MKGGENMQHKKFMAVAALVGATMFGGFGMTQASAFAGESPEFVTKLAQKLGISEDKVQQAFDALRQEHHVDMRKQMEDKLNQGVQEGKLTEEQKQLILDKHVQMKTERESQKSAFEQMTDEQRKAAMKQKHDELEAWAKENDIDVSYILGKMGRPMMRRHWVK